MYNNFSKLKMKIVFPYCTEFINLYYNFIFHNYIIKIDFSFKIDFLKMFFKNVF